jgi:hypothetical protein
MTTYDSYKGVPLDKLAIDVKWWEYCNGGCSMSLSNRLWEIHEETRWVSVLERLPSREDGYAVLVINAGYGCCVTRWDLVDKHVQPITHWKRIVKPETP